MIAFCGTEHLEILRALSSEQLGGFLAQLESLVGVVLICSSQPTNSSQTMDLSLVTAQLTLLGSPRIQHSSPPYISIFIRDTGLPN